MAVTLIEMVNCRSCLSEIPANSRFCLTCGSSVNGAAEAPLDATLALSAHPSAPAGTPSHAGNFDEGRFLPGTLIADRYRIIGRVGSGGMGEVYRANDLRLGQTVALKFLPEAMVHDPGMLARFHNEVRIARQVTHPNVCRVYDIGEVDGQPFISMQFVDGEDLSTLLRRIGRLPQDKSVEIARHLCAGLAAAHAQGVLHRDLKPANVMLDGRGQVIITDFGLAGLVEQMQGAEVRNGTPAYMAPEQLTGKEVSVQSDIYALGLVLYEMFSGQPAHRANTLAEMLKLREESQPAELSTLVHDIDPAVERVILRCLEPDPRKRPASALAVSAALPGGDPLAAALAAGETPSPEMVAEAGSTEGLRPRIAAILVSVVAVGLILFAALASRLSIANKVNLEMPPEALAIKARDLIRGFGYPASDSADRAYGLFYNNTYVKYLEAHEHSPERWAALINGQPPLVDFWYRESPRPLISIETGGKIYPDMPPMTVSGMVQIALDPQGRLAYFQAVPPQVDDSPGLQKPLDAVALFIAAGLDINQFKSTDPQWLPPAMADSRAAWTGTFPNRPENPIRIEAAAWHGRPVYFQVVGPWTTPVRMQVSIANLRDRAKNITFLALFLITGIAAIFMARQNLRSGRGDRKGALRMAAFAFWTSVIGWLCGAHHRQADPEIFLFFTGMGAALWQGLELWLLYLALEPHVRRRWPQTLIAWNRVLAGRLRDPLVGRDILIGTTVGMIYDLLFAASNSIETHLSGAPNTDAVLESILGFTPLLADVSRHVFNALQTALLFFFVIFLLRVLLRRQWIAATAFTLMFVVVNSLGSKYPVVGAAFVAVVFGLIVLTLMRFGLVALITSIFVTDLLPNFVFTTNFGAWYGSASLLVMLAVLGMAVYGYRVSVVQRAGG